MKRLLPLIFLMGCAGPEYYVAQREQTAAWERVEIARAQAFAKRYDALSATASGGSDLARVAVAFAIAGVGGNGSGLAPTQLPVIPDPDEKALRWTAILLGPLSNVALAGFNASVMKVQSNNQAEVAIASYGSIASVGTSGLGVSRDIALAGFDAFRSLPPSSVTTNTSNINVGAGSNAAWGGSSMAFDSSRRCQGAWSSTQSGTYPSDSSPFNC